MNSRWFDLVDDGMKEKGNPVGEAVDRGNWQSKTRNIDVTSSVKSLGYRVIIKCTYV